MQMKRVLQFCAVLALGLMPLFAQSITYNITANTGNPKAGGPPDCFGAANQTGDTFAISIKAAAKPKFHNRETATYDMPRGAVGGSLVTTLYGNEAFTNPNGWSMRIHLATSWVQFKGAGPHDSVLTLNVYLAPGTLDSSALEHPPTISSQSLGAKSELQYLDPSVCTATQYLRLPITGTIN